MSIAAVFKMKASGGTLFEESRLKAGAFQVRNSKKRAWPQMAKLFFLLIDAGLLPVGMTESLIPS
jgi:hypothetical protein